VELRTLTEDGWYEFQPKKKVSRGTAIAERRPRRLTKAGMREIERIKRRGEMQRCLMKPQEKESRPGKDKEEVPAVTADGVTERRGKVMG
jgi:hypothetical protein